VHEEEKIRIVQEDVEEDEEGYDYRGVLLG
jgi:hypothetical protein